MYRGIPPSPIFDVPEIPTLRRVKPLPKRRRTTGSADLDHHEDTLSLSSPALVAQSAQALLQQSALLHQHQQQQQQSLDVLGPNATAEELLAHADTLSARMALQSYYMPILGGVQSFLAGAAAIGNNGAGDRNNNTHVNNNNNTSNNNNGNTAAATAAAALAAVAGAGGGTGRNGQLQFPMPPGPLSDLDSLEFGVHFAAAAAAAAAAGVAMGGLGGLGMSLGMNGMNMSVGMGMGMNAGGTGIMAMGGGGGRDDDGRGDLDYIDHLQQHGNTKKRKVPANAGGSPRGGHSGDGGRPGSPSSLFPDDEHNGGGLGGGLSTASAELQRDRERDRDRDRDRDREDSDSSTPPVMYPPSPFPGQLSIVIQKRGKLTAATLAGLQHKEMLKSRKRQLAAVMGALSHGDTLALDQALSASYPLIGGLTGSVGEGGGGGGEGGEAQRVHKSKRQSIRLARVMRLTRVPRHPDAAPFPACDFGFVCPSASESCSLFFFLW